MDKTPEIKRAKFSLENFRVISFSYAEASNPEAELSLNFVPTGTYYEAEGRFDLTFTFTAVEEDENEAVNIATTMNAVFQFEPDTKLDDVTEYFYGNAIAMAYPYLRAFVSTLTLQAGGKVVILPVMNLGGLKDVLKDNTKLA